MELRAQAVLFRAGHDSDLLELELARRDIPFVKYGGLRYLDAAHVKDLVALLRIDCNPADELSWFRVLKLLDGVGPARARHILDALRPPGGGPPSPERWPEAARHVPAHARGHGAALMVALAGGDDFGGGGEDGRAGGGAGRAAVSPGARVERLCAALAPLIGLRYPDGAARADDLAQLVAAARGARDVRQFVSELVLDPPASSADLAGPPHLDEDYLVLSTVHSAKGLEWDAVHVISAYDGNFPADMNCAGEDGVAEERRLLYVALTRARKRLHVYVPRRYHHRPHGVDDSHGYGRASRFLTDAVQRLLRISAPGEGGLEAVGGEAPLRSPIGDAPSRRRIEVRVDSLFR
jgi:DNA helicase-2/ATP-dependent DNA helicase PcrA